MSNPRNAATAAATSVVDEMVRCGTTDVVLAPGSRSAPLALAAHEAAEAGRLRLHVRVDERTAGFLALGLAKTSRRPVPVVTTSGTAVANLHPAVLEASHAGVPLVVLSADRPAALRGTGANQTTDQVKVFGSAVREFADVPPGAVGTDEEGQVAAWRSLVARLLVVAAGDGPARPGPVHLNLQLAEPLVPGVDSGWRSDLSGGRPGGIRWMERPERSRPEPEPVTADLRTVVVAGDDAGPPARILAERAGWPLLAEPSSGARTGANAIRTYRLLLSDPELVARIEQVVMFGHPTLSRPVTRLLSRRDIDLVAVTGRSGWVDPGHAVTRLAAAVFPDDQEPEVLRWADEPPSEPSAGQRSEPPAGQPSEPPVGQSSGPPAGQSSGPPAGQSSEPPAGQSSGPLPGPPTPPPTSPWLEEWRARDREVSAKLDALLEAEQDLTPHHVAAEVSAALPARGLLFVGASNPVRDLDLMTARYEVGQRRLVVANRGLAGIDGSVSSAIGAALGRPHTSRAFALLGDVTFLHDSNALVIGPDEERPDLTIVVANDDGGSIFAGLEQGGASYAGSFERLFGTPHRTDLGRLCAATGTPHRRVTTRAELASALAAPAGGVEVVEATCRRDNRRELDAAIRALVTG